jgi:membrane-bound lytic murein transglycosylase B
MSGVERGETPVFPDSLQAVDSPRAAGGVIAVERCEYVTGDLLLRLSVRVPFELRSERPLLLVERQAVEHAYSPLLACTGRVPLSDSGEWMWRGAFPVPPDLACNPRALFTLRLREDVLLALPLPSERLFPGELVFGPQEPSQRAGSARTWPYAVRRGALLFVVTCQLGVPALSPAGALADGSPGAGTSAAPAPETPPTPPAGGPAQPAPETPPKEGGAGQSPAPTPTTQAPPITSTAPQAATPTPVATLAPADTAAPDASEPPTVVVERRQKTTAARKVAGGNTRKVAAEHAHRDRGGANTSMGGAPVLANNVAPAPGVVAAQAGALAAELARSAGSAQALGFYRIPLFLLPVYRAAAIQYGVPWQVLAAINEVETNYGSDLSVSSAGAEGWMQFMPATWLQYGVDAVDAGYADPYNPVDAIFAAARYLHAAGASKNLRAAILAYNHSEVYASSVLLRAKLISSYPKSVIATLTGLAGAHLPVTGKQLAWEIFAPSASSSSATGKAPQMVDLMSAPSAAVVAVQDGRILQLGSSRKLGKYVVLRDVYGDVFTYSGLGSIAPGDAPPKAAAGGSARVGRRTHLLSLRVGSVVTQGTVLGRVRVPLGAKDGHLHFAIRPAGDSNTIDPRPILANWRQLDTALHPRGAKGASNPLAVTASPKAYVAKVAHSAGAGGIAPSPLVISGELTATQWDQLITRIALLPAPKVAVKPSSAAIPDPQASANSRASGKGPLSSGG